MDIKKITGIFALTLMLPLAACDVDQTEEGELPDIEVEAEGNLPEYGVEGPDVEVETDTMEIRTPDVDIEPPTDAGNR